MDFKLQGTQQIVEAVSYSISEPVCSGLDFYSPLRKGQCGRMSVRNSLIHQIRPQSSSRIRNISSFRWVEKLMRYRRIRTPMAIQTTDRVAWTPWLLRTIYHDVDSFSLLSLPLSVNGLRRALSPAFMVQIAFAITLYPLFSFDVDQTRPLPNAYAGHA